VTSPLVIIRGSGWLGKDSRNCFRRIWSSGSGWVYWDMATEGGLDAAGLAKKLEKAVQEIRDKGITVSLFVDRALHIACSSSCPWSFNQAFAFSIFGTCVLTTFQNLGV
jgi:hypothetical protein